MTKKAGATPTIELRLPSVLEMVVGKGRSEDAASGLFFLEALFSFLFPG